jgi:hypothetical protein
MCCPLILCRKEAISRAEGPSRMTRSTKERTKRMRKKECDIRDKMLMNSSSNKSFKQEEKITTSHLSFITGCHHAPMIKLTS